MYQTLYTYRSYVAAAIIGILAVGAYAFTGMRDYDASASGNEPMVRAQNFVREGYLLNGHPELKPNTWYLIHSQNGEEAKAAELLFDEESRCASAKASGTCRPDLFVNQRTAQVEGVWEGEQLRVLELTFTQTLK